MKNIATAQQCARTMYEADRASRGLGIEVRTSSPGKSEARMKVTEKMINGFDVCHGGYIFLLADSAFAFACNGYDDMTFAAGASVEFLRTARFGDQLCARASEIYRGSRRGVYDVTVSNQDDEIIAIFRGRSRSTGRSIVDRSDT